MTLRKHLAKEEDQLFPLLLKHFTFAEQVSTEVEYLFQQHFHAAGGCSLNSQSAHFVALKSFKEEARLQFKVFRVLSQSTGFIVATSSAWKSDMCTGAAAAKTHIQQKIELMQCFAATGRARRAVPVLHSTGRHRRCAVMAEARGPARRTGPACGTGA